MCTASSFRIGKTAVKILSFSRFCKSGSQAQGTSQVKCIIIRLYIHGLYIHVYVCLYLETCKTTQASRLMGSVFREDDLSL